MTLNEKAFDFITRNCQSQVNFRVANYDLYSQTYINYLEPKEVELEDDILDRCELIELEDDILEDGEKPSKEEDYTRKRFSITGGSKRNLSNLSKEEVKDIIGMKNAYGCDCFAKISIKDKHNLRSILKSVYKDYSYLVVDIDREVNLDLNKMELDGKSLVYRGCLPTCINYTGSGGIHIYYAYDQEIMFQYHVDYWHPINEFLGGDPKFNHTNIRIPGTKNYKNENICNCVYFNDNMPQIKTKKFHNSNYNPKYQADKIISRYKKQNIGHKLANTQKQKEMREELICYITDRLTKEKKIFLDTKSKEIISKYLPLIQKEEKNIKITRKHLKIKENKEKHISPALKKIRKQIENKKKIKNKFIDCSLKEKVEFICKNGIKLDEDEKTILKLYYFGSRINGGKAYISARVVGEAIGKSFQTGSKKLNNLVKQGILKIESHSNYRSAKARVYSITDLVKVHTTTRTTNSVYFTSISNDVILSRLHKNNSNDVIYYLVKTCCALRKTSEDISKIFNEWFKVYEGNHKRDFLSSKLSSTIKKVYKNAA